MVNGASIMLPTTPIIIIIDPLGSYSEGNTGTSHGQLTESSGNWAIDPDVFIAADAMLYLT